MSHVHLLLHFLTWGSAEYLYAVCGGETNPASGDLNNLYRGLEPHWQVVWVIQSNEVITSFRSAVMKKGQPGDKF